MSQTNLDSALQAIAEKVLPASKFVRHWPLAGGVSAQITAFEVAQSGGRSSVMVMRSHGAHEWKPHEDDVATMEFALLNTLSTAGIPVPNPLLLDSTCTILPAPFYVMEMVEGTTVIAVSHLRSALDQMADFLVQLHALNINIADGVALPHREDPVAGALEYIPNSSKWAPLRAVIDGWEISPVDDSILHGDFWPGNILWHQGNLSAVIDWEDAAIGTAVSDIACARVELMVMYGESAMEQFSRRYLTASGLKITDLPLWEIYSGFAALAHMGDWGLATEVEAVRREQTTIFVNRACSEIIA